MKIQFIDELFITRPMSEEERHSLLKSFQEISYLQGIDKGTTLERDTIYRLQSFKENSFKKKYLDIFERLTDFVHVGVKRNNRRKYYGNPTKIEKVQQEKKNTTINNNLPAWLQ